MGCGASAKEASSHPHGTTLSDHNPAHNGFEKGIVPANGEGSGTLPLKAVYSEHSSASHKLQRLSHDETHGEETPGRDQNKKKPLRPQQGEKEGKAPMRTVNHEMKAESRKLLSKVLGKHFLFAGLEDDERNELISYMVKQKASGNEVIFSQGDKGDCCYVIQSGSFNISVDGVEIRHLRKMQTFGELAMLYNVSRTATITCAEAGVLWRMDGDTFRHGMDELSTKHLALSLGFFDNDPKFAGVSPDDRKKLARLCSVQVFARETHIIRQGEVDDWMFIVLDGNVQISSGLTHEIMKPGSLLGSTGFMYTNHQVYSAKAINTVMCASFSRAQLEQIPGSALEVIQSCAIKALLLDDVQTSNELDFFKALTDTQQDMMAQSFEDVFFNEGELVITPGAPPQLILVDKGELAIVPSDVADQVGGCSAKAKELAEEVLTAGMVYGGSCLIQNRAIDKYFFSCAHTRIHRLDSGKIARILDEPLGLAEVIRLNEIKEALSEIFLFKNLHGDQLTSVVRSMETRRYQPHDCIVTQGDEAKHFFLIESGTISVKKHGAEVRALTRWDFFGERGLLLHDKRSATCEAIDDVVCFVLQAQVFIDIVGVFRKELEHRMHLQDLEISMDDLRMTAVVGHGSFGITKVVHHKEDETKVYALKCVSKKQVVEQGQQKTVCVEREINALCYHPCIVQFIKTFQDISYVYFLQEFLGGGDLFTAIRSIGSLSKHDSQFYSASIVLALEYLHHRNIMYRDLKPENVLLDYRGNAKLVDFGRCKQCLRTTTLVGTPEYFAPETIAGKGYSCAVDWWALGVVLYELIVGPLPFGSGTSDQLELFRQIMEAPLHIPKHIDDKTASSIISGLLQRKAEQRLGAASKGALEIKEHKYYLGFDWDGIVGRYINVPYLPEKNINHDAMLDGEKVSMEEDVHTMTEDMAWAAAF